jgi:hypothetical protein
MRSIGLIMMRECRSPGGPIEDVSPHHKLIVHTLPLVLILPNLDLAQVPSQSRRRT